MEHNSYKPSYMSNTKMMNINAAEEKCRFVKIVSSNFLFVKFVALKKGALRYEINCEHHYHCTDVTKIILDY